MVLKDISYYCFFRQRIRITLQLFCGIFMSRCITLLKSEAEHSHASTTQSFSPSGSQSIDGAIPGFFFVLFFCLLFQKSVQWLNPLYLSQKPMYEAQEHSDRITHFHYHAIHKYTYLHCAWSENCFLLLYIHYIHDPDSPEYNVATPFVGFPLLQSQYQ